MGGVTRQSAGSIGRPVILFALIIALCCLPGCGLITGALGGLDDDQDSSPNWQRQDDDGPKLDASKDLSFSGGLRKPACRTALLNVA